MAIGKLNLKLGIDVSDLSKELGKVERAMARFGSQMQSIGSTMTQSITLPLLGVGAASLKAFADMEKLEKGMTSIMGSADVAKQEIEKLREVAKLPGLGLKEAVQGSINLQAVGLSAEEAKNTLTGFGTALAATGKGKVELEAIQYQLTQMISKNKLLAEDYKVIQSNLPLMAEGMRAAFGSTNIEAIRDTGISAKDFVMQLSNALLLLPETQNVTGGLANSFENLGDNIFIALSEFGNAINKSLNLEKVFNNVSNTLQYLVDGFIKLKPEVQNFIVGFGLIALSIGPAIFIIGKLISTYGALAGISEKVVKGIGKISDAIKYLAANPQILIITASIAALGAIALYVYDNWKAFQDNFTNIWINIKNSFGVIIADILKKVDKLQKSLGLKLFNLEGLTEYQKEQRIVATEFKSIGDTVDSLKGKLGSLFTVDTKGKQNASTIIEDKNTDKTTNLDNKKIDKKLFKFDEFKTLPELAKFTEEINKAVISEIAPKTMEQLGLKEGKLTLLSMKNTANDVLALGEKLKKNPPNMAKPFSDADAAAIKLQERMAELSEASKALTIDLKNLIEGVINDVAVGFGEQLGNALSGAKFEIKALLAPIADAIIAFGKMAIQAGITALAIKKALTLAQAPLAIAAGIALVAIGSAIKNGLAVPKLAQGGLAFGPTMATVGDNRNARVDPEVIAPLSKLKNMLSDVGGMGGTLETKISGNDLIILLNRSQKTLNRVQ